MTLVDGWGEQPTINPPRRTAPAQTNNLLNGILYKNRFHRCFTAQSIHLIIQRFSDATTFAARDRMASLPEDFRVQCCSYQSFVILAVRPRRMIPPIKQQPDHGLRAPRGGFDKSPAVLTVGPRRMLPPAKKQPDHGFMAAQPQ